VRYDVGISELERNYMSDSNLVISDPNIMMGKPVIIGTIITVELILEKLAAGKTPAEIIADHPLLTPEAISAALTFTTKKLKAEPLPPTRLIQWLIDKNILCTDKKVTFQGHLLVTLGLLSLIPITCSVMWLVAISWEQKWLNCSAQKLIQPKELFDSQINNKQKIRLGEQLKTINELKVNHCEIMTFFYTQYYISLSILSIAGLISLVCIFFVSKEGWAKANNAIINLAITSAVITIAFLNITQIFQQSQNLKASQDLYANYTVLQDDFLSSLATDQLIVDTKTEKLTDYKLLIQFTDSRLSELSLIRLGFDPTPILDMKGKINSFIDLGKESSLTKPPMTLPSPSPK
jgi:uncharacterized protein (DUF433 family)